MERDLTPWSWEEHRRTCIRQNGQSEQYERLCERVIRRNVEEYPDTLEIWGLPECLHGISRCGDVEELEAPCADGMVWTFVIAGDRIERVDRRPVTDDDRLL